MTITPEEHMTRLMADLNRQLESIESLAEQTFLNKVAELSLRYPGFTVEAVGGNGALYVTVYDPHGAERRYYSHGDPRPDNPKTHEFLFGWMEELEDELGNYYANFPMVAPGIVKFKDGVKL